MSFEFDPSEEIGTGGTYLEEAGTYHLTVNTVGEGTGPKGNPITGFSIGCQVMAGTTPGQEEKETSIVFFNPKLDGSEIAQRINREQQTAFLIAAGLITPADLGKKGLMIDLQKAIGQQIMATLVENEYNGRTTLQLRFADVFHIDDPRAKAFPKNAETVAMIPVDLRKGESFFTPLTAKKTAKQQPAAAAMSQDDLNDL